MTEWLPSARALKQTLPFASVGTAVPPSSEKFTPACGWGPVFPGTFVVFVTSIAPQFENDSVTGAMKSLTSLLKLCEARLETCAEVKPSHAPAGTIPAQVRLIAASPQRPVVRARVGLMMSSWTFASLP